MPMGSRELIRSIIARATAPRCGFWLGNPHPDTLPLYYRYFGVRELEALHRKLGSDFRWITPQFMETTYRHPLGKGIFDLYKYKKSLGEVGPLGTSTSVKEVEEHDWPNPEYLNFEECLGELRTAGDVYRASGFWMPFFHDTMDLFGVEGFMMNMYERPEVVHAALDHVCGFYYEANERFFRISGGLVDGFFFGNDFGTQRDLLISPSQFDAFILPWFRRFTDQAHRFGLQVILHSCGSIYRIIERLIDAGVDCLHPLQARAERMDANTLARDFQGRIAFLGGIDTQSLLNHGTPGEVRAEVRRIKQILGPNLIVSPSHEALLPDVPPSNIAAMAEEALA